VGAGGCPCPEGCLEALVPGALPQGGQPGEARGLHGCGRREGAVSRFGKAPESSSDCGRPGCDENKLCVFDKMV